MADTTHWPLREKTGGRVEGRKGGSARKGNGQGGEDVTSWQLQEGNIHDAVVRGRGRERKYL